MPLRFRKSFKIAPGIRINLSKSGVSTSIGKRGASVNLSKRGTRVTTGIPGTGISFSQLFGGKKAKTQGDVSSIPNLPSRPVIQSQKGTKIPFLVMVLSGIVAIICQVMLCSAVVSEFLAPPTPIPTFDLVAAQNTAIAEAWVSYTQTMIAESTNNPLPTATLPPTETMMPTETTSTTPSPLPTATLIVFVTDTPFFLNLPANQPTSAPVGGTCPCSGDTLNCGDFNTHAAAQACYSYCVSQGAGDIHKLDGNNDGSACESLP